MRYHFFLHYGWFFQNLRKEALPSFMHTTVRCGERGWKMRISARAPRRTRKWATKVRNLEQEMRQNNVVFVFARGEKFRQNILIPDFHSRLLGLCV